MNLIALVGFIGSGKDTVGKYLVEEHGFRDIAFADALKDTCAAIFGWDREMLDGKSPESRAWRDQVDPWWSVRLGNGFGPITNFTPRWALQNIGTRVMRQHFDDNVWILNVERRIQMMQAVYGPTTKIVITDARFPNELDMVRRLNGRIARVRRGPDPEWFEIAKIANNPADIYAEQAAVILNGKYRDVHESERAWIGQPVDHLLDNDGSLEDLKDQAFHTLIGAPIQDA